MKRNVYMGEFIKLIVAIVNELHDVLIDIMYGLGFYSDG